jgi:ATP-dependent helicase/nuclease subunit B
MPDSQVRSEIANRPMPNPDHAKLEFRAVDAGFWPALADRALCWWRDRGIDVRDAVLLLPFAELLPLAREAFAARGGWQPRVETTHTLACALGPAAARSAGSLSFDDATDRLAAAALLRGQAWAGTLTQHDARGMEDAAASVVRCAGRWARHAATLPPLQREPFWDQARSRLAPVSLAAAHSSATRAKARSIAPGPLNNGARRLRA